MQNSFLENQDICFTANNNSQFKNFTKIEGNVDCFNDVLIFKSTNLNANYNLIYFGGDIQDYHDEMKKSSSSHSFTKWNLINTGFLLLNKFSTNPKTNSNIFIIRADYFHLKCFANYSNFVPSTDFGVPIVNSNDFLPKLDANDDSSNSSTPSNDNISNKLRCFEHLQKLFHNSITKFNSDLNENNLKIDPNLPIILCGFSKGCIVLNQLCNELPNFNQECSNELNIFLNCIKHLIWLDGGHSGTSDSWIVRDEIIKLIKRYDWSCYVYVTPYQLKSRKYWAIEEYKKFVDLLEKFHVKRKNVYYFKEKEDDDFDVNIHFDLLVQFQTELI